jgi:hypothetical protein
MVSLEVIVLKTNEISNQQWDQIVNGFNETFKSEVTVENLKCYYLTKCLGYSFHALAINENGMVVGSTTVVPYRYSDRNGRIFLTGLSGGTYILKDFRKNEFLFFEMYSALRKTAFDNGLELILGVPNKNSFFYTIRYLNFKYLFDLDYFVLPIRIASLLKSSRFRILNYLSLALAFFWILFSFFYQFVVKSKDNRNSFNIVADEDFCKQRYDMRYKTFSHKKYRCWYRIFNEGDLKTAYILDFREGQLKTAMALNKAVLKILTSENIDVIAYIGTMNIKQFVLFKLPTKMVPKQFKLTVDVLNKEKPDLESSYLSPQNWTFSLLNFDVR